MERGEFTYHEIISQPSSWAAALEVLKSQHSAIVSVWRKGYTQVLFTGCGSTYYLALAAAALLQELTGIPARGLPASELWLYPQACYPRNGRVLLIAVSRSGETTETLRACQAFKEGQYGELLTLSCYARYAAGEDGRPQPGAAFWAGAECGANAGVLDPVPGLCRAGLFLVWPRSSRLLPGFPKQVKKLLKLRI